MMKAILLLFCLLVSMACAFPRVSYPLTVDDFERAKHINERELMDMYGDHGGPMDVPPVEMDLNAQSNLRCSPPHFQVWPNGIIPYTISAGFTENDRAVIARSIQILESSACIRFVPTTNFNSVPRMDIVARQLGGFCFATWRTNCGSDVYSEVTLTPASSCTVTRTTVHELYHGLGFYHTHARPDRANFVNVHLENVFSNSVVQFNQCSGCCCDTFGRPYDCNSVMHYAADQMSFNGRNTLTAVNPNTCRLLPFREWNVFEPVMSQNDVEVLAEQYRDFC